LSRLAPLPQKASFRSVYNSPAFHQGAAMPTFDIVSKIDLHELDNAVDQATRELTTRFDFKGVGAEFELDEAVISLSAKAEFQLKQMLDILKVRLAGRGIDIACAEIGDAEVNLATARQKVTLKQGIDQPLAKQIMKTIKDAGLKVQTSIQGDKLRVSGKKRDDLQAAIALLRASKIEMPLQYENFRD
jgi:cyclic-di-GMP-binding protein